VKHLKRVSLPKRAEDNKPIDIQFIVDVMTAFIAKKQALT